MSHLAGVSTYSKSPERFIPNVYPKYAERASGCFFWDPQGNCYVDWMSGIGTITLGWNNPRINNAIKGQLEKGINFSLPTKLEEEVAELISENVPCAEKVILCKDGSDSTAGAIRLARLYTGEEHIIQYEPSYHGWGDQFQVIRPINAGIPKCLKKTISTFNTPEELSEVLEKTKAKTVILEPMIWDETEEFVKKVEKITHENSAVLIMDEIVTVPRFDIGGISKTLDIKSDIVTLGKGLGSGMPFACIAGREDILNLRRDEKVFFSGTYFGEALTLVAVKETIKEFKEREADKWIWYVGDKLKTEFNKMTQEIGINASIFGYPPRLNFDFDNIEEKSLFLQLCIEEGIFFCPDIIYPQLMHTDRIIGHTLAVMQNSLSILREAIDKEKVENLLKGKVREESIRGLKKR